jgi:hypothetical protein
MSVACLLIFLIINKMRLDIDPDSLTQKALWLAQTTHDHDFLSIKQDLESWIGSHLIATD